MKYDYVIVGSGLFGAVFAREMTNAGKKCLVIEKKPHIGGNCYTENRQGINVHMYGPHIFHTNSERIWKYINQYANFHQYKHTGKAMVKGKVYSLPINLSTMQQVWPNVTTPALAREKLASFKASRLEEDNLKSWAINQIGEELYYMFIHGYTEKQWGTDPANLPSSIIKRLPIRTSFNDNYFFDNYQGIPINGYTLLFDKLLDGIPVLTNCNYFTDRKYWNSLGKKVVFTGQIDRYFDYQYGPLEYRSLRFVHERHGSEDFQGCSIMNYPDEHIPWTRITEHKHFAGAKHTNGTWITYEYPAKYTGENPYYPIETRENRETYDRYASMAAHLTNVIFGGRLAEYRYYDMDQVIASALHKASKELI